MTRPALTMDAAALRQVEAVFASGGITWLWGCSFPRVVHPTLWAMERAMAYKSSGLGDAFSKNYLGFGFDPKGSRYAVYKSTWRVPPPDGHPQG